jgi:hypothetical protein
MVTYRMVERSQTLAKAREQQLNTTLQGAAGERHLRHGMPAVCSFLYRIGRRWRVVSERDRSVYRDLVAQAFQA